MQSESVMQQLIALVIAIAAVIVLLIFVPRQHYHPVGIVLPAQTVRAATSPDDVSVYQKMPLMADKLGYISIEMHASSAARRQQDQLAMINKAKALAATVGANAVVFNIGYGASPEGQALSYYYLMGYAIYTSVPTNVDLDALFNSPS